MQGVLAGIKLRNNAESKEEQATAADVRWLAGVQRVVGQGRNKHWLVPLR
jgi:hypothetical protein